MRFATRTIHGNQPVEPATGAVSPPIFQTSTFQQSRPGEHQGFDYSRTNNPSRQRLEAALADLEGAAGAAAFASGLAAENAVLQALLRPGHRVLAPLDVYGGTYRLLEQVYSGWGCRIDTIDFSNRRAVQAALSEPTRLVWIESPTNPRLLVYDIKQLAEAARRAGALTVVDNTFATPWLQRPLDLGADVVVHSVTKYLAGHSDLIQGAVAARDPGLLEKIRFLQNAAGAVPGPFDCWLTLRGLRTLELRMQRHVANAAAIAEALCGHPVIGRVYYPGLPDHPGHEIARKQMRGFGGIVSAELRVPVAKVVEFVSTRRYFALAESLGGVRALICHPATMTHASIPLPQRQETGLSDRLIRISPGCEDAEDLIEDLRTGLDELESQTPMIAANPVGEDRSS